MELELTQSITCNSVIWVEQMEIPQHRGETVFRSVRDYLRGIRFSTVADLVFRSVRDYLCGKPFIIINLVRVRVLRFV
jgi:hypothetical protein